MSWWKQKLNQLVSNVEYKARRIYVLSNDFCEIELENLTSASYDIERLGYRFVDRADEASLMMVSGWLNDAFIKKIQEDYAALLLDKAVLAIGSSIISGSPYVSDEKKIISDIIPVDLYLPGSPPRPEALIQALLHLENIKLEKWKTKETWVYEVLKSNG